MNSVPPSLNSRDLSYHRPWGREIFIYGFQKPVLDVQKLPMCFVDNDIVTVVFHTLHEQQISIPLILSPDMLPLLSFVIFNRRLLRLI
jgi:hypothetical protein